MTLLSPLFNQLSPLGVAAGIPRGVESNYALGFDGVDDYVSLTSVPVSAAPITISLWAKPDNTNAGVRRLIAISDATSTQIVTVYQNGTSVVGQYAGLSGSNISTSIITTNWQLITVVITSSSSIIIYVNGMPATEGTSNAGIVNSLSTATIGRWTNAAIQFFAGKIDDVRIYNIALTADQVSQIYNNSLPPPTTGLVGYWNFEEGTGTSTADQSGNGNNGTLVGGPTWQPQVSPRLIRGRNNEDWGVSLDGANDYISLPSSIISGTTDFTLCGWIKVTTVALSGQTLITTFGSTPPGYQIGLTGESIFCYVGTGISVFGGNITAGVWHHIAATRSGTTVKVYQNGVEVGSDIRSVTNLTMVNARIGSNLAGGELMNGLTKDIRIYSSALPLTSIQKLSRGIEPSETPIARWRLNEGTGTTANDSIGTNHGTLTNGPTWTGDIPQWFRQTIESTQSLNLDGVNDYVDVGAGIDALIQDDMTLTTWIKPAAGALIASNRGPVATAGWEFVTDGSAKLLVQNSVGGYMTASTAVGSTNIWNAATFTRSGASYHIYLNGVLDDSADKANVSGSLGSTSPLLIGKNGRTGSVMNGLVDDVCIYNRALSAAEAADQAAGYLVTAGLVSHYKLDGNANDSVGSNHGTEQGGVGYSTNVPGTL